jgi:hypothetical protein
MGGYLLSTPWNGIILSLAIWHRSPVGQMRRHHDQLRKLKTSNNLAVLGGS